MNAFIIQLLRCSFSMAIVTVLYMLTTILLKRHYTAKGFYYSGIMVLLGFLIPFRPHINITLPPHLSPGFAELSADISRLEYSLTTSSESMVHTAAAGNMIVKPEQVVFITWLLGVVAILLYYMVQHVRFLKMVKRWSSPILDKQSLILLGNQKKHLEITSDIELRTCAAVSSPMLISMPAPTILLPDYPPTEEELNLILHHEMIHFKRKDLLYKSILILAVSINWFNPAVYLFAKIFSHICEISCDEEVTEGLNESTRYQYAMLIIDAARRHSAQTTAFSTHFYGGKEKMKHRISAIMNHSKRRIGAALLIICFILTLSAGTVFAAESTGIYIDPVDHTEEYWEALFQAEKETLREIIVAFDEEFDPVFNEKDFEGMTITYDKDGIPIIDDPDTSLLETASINATVKYKNRPLYTTSACDNSRILFYIPKGKAVEVIDSYVGGSTAKIRYAGKIGYIQKSHLKF